MDLKQKIESKEAKICIIGLGYVGLPLSLLWAKNNFKVLGIDKDNSKINCINSGKSYINHINDKVIYDYQTKGLLTASKKIELVKVADVIIMCLPTPLNEYREPDLSFIINTLEEIGPHLKKGQALCLESTTYPGTTEEVLKPSLEKHGFEIGKNFYLIYSPEREDPGNKKFEATNIPKIVGGVTQNCLKIGVSIYENIIKEVIPVSSTKTAEMTKLLENIHRAVNIGLMNEIKPLADKLGVDLYEVIDAAATKPFGFVPYYPGPGLGGHCIPIDPFYLTWKARKYGMHTRFIELAGEINTSMPKYVVSKTIEALNNEAKSLKKSRVLVLGISYKKNIDDARESPSVEIIKLLLDSGAEVNYSDKYFPEFPKMRKYEIKIQSIELNKKELSRFDIVILSTDHDYFDYELIENQSNIIIDTRGRFHPSPKIIRA